jgi:hypothetical protein
MYFHTDHHEIDIVMQRPDGTWGAIEAKLGGGEPIEQGAESLLAAVSSIDLERAGTPAFVAVVTATGRYAYRRDDGVCVVPLSTLPADMAATTPGREGARDTAIRSCVLRAVARRFSGVWGRIRR